MSMSFTRTRRAACMLLLLFAGPGIYSAWSADAWHVAEAPVRFRLSLGQGPSHSSAGYYLHLPDGGILPGPNPVTRVVDSSGKIIKSYALWQNPGKGMAVIIAKPASGGSLYAYVASGRQMNYWKPGTGITPSPLLCAAGGKNALASARQLAQMGRVGPKTSFQLNEAYGRAPLSIRGDLSGRPRPASLYLLAYVNTSDPGKTWIAPFKEKDSVEVRIDGQAMTAQRRIDKWGGTGAWVNLDKGLHRVELFAACGGTGGYGGNGVVYLTWATPSASDAELGGTRPTSAKFPGTSKWASRPINASEIVASGRCSIRETQMRDGSPVARIRARAIENYWVGNNPPVYVYEFSAVKTGNPDGTRYSWDFGNGARADGESVRWLLAGQRDHAIRLTATHQKGKSSATVPVYAFSTIRTSMNDRNDRENIRKAFLDVIQAHPETADVAARWHAGMWQCFYDVQELGKGHALLNEVLLKRGASFRKHIPESYMPHLEDIFFYWISHKHPDKAIAWLKKAAQQSKIPEQKNGLKIRMAEVNMYHKKNFTEARRILKTQTLSSRSHAIVATIRLGDVAFLAGNLNEANRYWGKVENKTDVAEAIAADAEGVRWAGEAARSGEISSERSKMLGMTRRAGGNRKQDWRKEAVLDSNISTSINSLLKQGYFEEALQELTLWERFFPMSKLTEDFILLEARCYMAMDNISRARTLLEAYCNVVEASSFLPDAAELLENCMKNQRAPKSELKAFYEKMSKRLEYHPTGQRMKERLEYL